MSGRNDAGVNHDRLGRGSLSCYRSPYSHSERLGTKESQDRGEQTTGPHEAESQMHSVNRQMMFCSQPSILPGFGVGHRGCVREIAICLEATKGWITMDLGILISSSLTLLVVIYVMDNVWAE